MACMGSYYLEKAHQDEAVRFGLGEYGIWSDVASDVACGAVLAIPESIYNGSEEIRGKVKDFCENANYFGWEGQVISFEQFQQEFDLVEKYHTESFEHNGEKFVVVY